MRLIFNIIATTAYQIKSFLKIVLKFMSKRWLRSALNLVNNLIPLGLWQLQTLFSDGRKNFEMFFLRDINFLFGYFCQSCFIQLQSKKTNFFKKIMSCFKRRTIFHVSCKVYSATHWNNIEVVFRRLLIKVLMKTTKLFLRDFDSNSIFFRNFPHSSRYCKRCIILNFL